MEHSMQIQKVAQTLADTYGGQWQAHLVAAKAAILALREPSSEMLAAALPDVPDWGYLPDHWRMMIDSAAADERN